MALVLTLPTACVSYLYPLYATYKVLTATERSGSSANTYAWYSTKKRERADSADAPTELATLESLCMYWCILAVVRIAEMLGGWSWRW